MSADPFDHLIRHLSALPGLGPRSARRVALYLLMRKDQLMIPLAQTLQHAASAIKTCTDCGNFDTSEPCRICTDSRRDLGLICVVATVADLWAIERAHAHRGAYHVLGGVLSALDGIRPDDLKIAQLLSRIENNNITEIILALPATVDGQTTAHYLTDRLQNIQIKPKITRLAHGLPVGGELDYLDDGTITTALKSRSSV